jgi:hypothetical protein
MKLIEKQRELERKDEMRKTHLEIRKKEIENQSRYKAAISKRKLELTLSCAEEKLRKQKEV